jgi:hypothetical protein
VYIHKTLYLIIIKDKQLHLYPSNNIGGQIIRTVRYADDLVLLAMEETVLQSMIDNLIEVGRGD